MKYDPPVRDRGTGATQRETFKAYGFRVAPCVDTGTLVSMRSFACPNFLPSFLTPTGCPRSAARFSISISSRDRAQTCRPPWRNSARPWSRGEYDRRRARAREDEGAQEGSRWRPDHEAALHGVQNSEGDWVVYAKETRRLRYSTARSSTTRCPPCCPERRERERRAGTEYT